MRSIWLAFLVGAVGCKPGGVSETDELCAKAAAIYSQCESRGNSTEPEWEIVVDRWRGLCQATFTGNTKQLYGDGLAIWQQLDDEERVSLRETGRCTAAATTCAAYQACQK